MVSAPAFSTLVVACVVTCAASAFARSEAGFKLRRAEQSVEMLSEQSDASANEAQMEPAVTASSATEIKLISSMGALMQSADQQLEPSSPKAQLQRRLVALIWLERTYQQNLESMDEAAYTAKIGKGNAGLEKDTSPATAAMLTRMRTEMHQFAVPFYQHAVQDELKTVRARQKVLLDKIIALDADGESDDQTPASLTEEDAPQAAAKKEKKEEKEEKKDKEVTKAEAIEKQHRRAQSSMLIWIMAVMMGALILLVLGIALRVKFHLWSQASA